MPESEFFCKKFGDFMFLRCPVSGGDEVVLHIDPFLSRLYDAMTWASGRSKEELMRLAFATNGHDEEGLRKYILEHVHFISDSP